MEALCWVPERDRQAERLEGQEFGVQYQFQRCGAWGVLGRLGQNQGGHSGHFEQRPQSHQRDEAD